MFGVDLLDLRLHNKAVIDFQYFEPSMKNMKNIHFLLTDKIGYSFACL